MMLMANTTKPTRAAYGRALEERIVEAAIEILDTAGEGALTFRALTERLATGPGRSTGTSRTRTSCSPRRPTPSSLG